MGWVLKYDEQSQFVKPSLRAFTHREVFDLIHSNDYVLEDILNYNCVKTGYKMAYNPEFSNSPRHFNFLATKYILMPKFSRSEHALLCIDMRLHQADFIKKYPHCIFIGGYALFAKEHEFKGL